MDLQTAEQTCEDSSRSFSQMEACEAEHAASQVALSWLRLSG